MSLRTVVLVSIVVLAGLLADRATASSVEEASAALRDQMSAWNKQDLESALSYYWDSPEMTWVNRKGISFGIQEFAQSMRQDFSDRSKMGLYDGKVLHASQLRDDLVLIVLDWKIVDSAGKKLMGGVSSQLWQRKSGGWKIVFEHAS